MNPKQRKITTATQVPGLSARRNRLIVGLPLVVSLLFAFGYLHVQWHSQQRLTAADQAQHQKTSVGKPDLPLVTQPVLPALSQAPDNNPDSAPTDLAPDAIGVGPSPTNAAATLQSTNDSMNHGGNDQLQATRRAVKLDELNL